LAAFGLSQLVSTRPPSGRSVLPGRFLRRLLRASVLWVVTLMLIAVAAQAARMSVPYESWMGGYLGSQKIGYMSFKIDEADFDGISGYRIASVLNSRLKILDADLTQIVNTVVYTDADFNPLKEDFNMSSGGKKTSVKATFESDAVDCVVSGETGGTNVRVPIPAGARLVGDMVFGLLDTTLEIGKQYSVHYFNPLTLAVDELKVKVKGKEKIVSAGREVETYVLFNSTPMGDLTIWQEADGSVVQAKAVMGIVFKREPKEEAMAGMGAGEQEDFATLTSVKPNRKIPNPRQLRSLGVVMTGITDAEFLISDSRQSASFVGAKPGSVRYKIRAEEFRAEKSISRPVTDPQFSEHLTSSPYLDFDKQAVAAKSAEIVGDEKSAYRGAQKIRAWVYDNMVTRADIGIARSASDVLESREGVCRDYAILFGALARAAGIPCKVVSGVLYTQDAFYYHSWVECYVGEWVPFDATLPTDFVDATHVKMAEGDATSMFSLSKVIGGLKADVRTFH